MNTAQLSIPGHSLGDLLRAALGLYRRGIVPFLALSILSSLGFTDFLSLLGPLDDLFRLLPGWFQALVVVAAALVGILAGLAFTYVTADLYHGRAPGIRDSLGRALGRFWAVIRLALLGYVAWLVPVSLLSFVYSSVPALRSGHFSLSTYHIALLAVGAPLILLLPMALALPALQLESHLGAVGAVKRSWALVRGVWWPTAGVLLFVLLLSWLPAWGVTSLVNRLNAPLLSGLLAATLYIASAPLIGIVATLLYYERSNLDFGHLEDRGR